MKFFKEYQRLRSKGLSCVDAFDQAHVSAHPLPTRAFMAFIAGGAIAGLFAVTVRLI